MIVDWVLVRVGFGGVKLFIVIKGPFGGGFTSLLVGNLGLEGIKNERGLTGDLVLSNLLNQ